MTIEVDESREEIAHAPAKRGSVVTIHDTSTSSSTDRGGTSFPTRQRRTYVLANRLSSVVAAERSIGFTIHSHNDDVVNYWDTFHTTPQRRRRRRGTRVRTLIACVTLSI